MQIPFKDRGRGRDGCDCWGWVRLLIECERGLIVPALADGYETATDKDDIARLIASEAPRWQKVDTDEALRFDVVALRIGRKACHVGLVVAPGQFSHLERNRPGATIERLDGPRWRNRIAGVYRWPALA